MGLPNSVRVFSAHTPASDPRTQSWRWRAAAVSIRTSRPSSDTRLQQEPEGDEHEEKGEGEERQSQPVSLVRIKASLPGHNGHVPSRSTLQTHVHRPRRPT